MDLFLSSLQGYSRKRFRKDITAGIIVGIIALPLGMAFAIASGVKPEYGLYTTIIAGILISLLGGSKYQIGGPTGAFIPILFAIVSQYGYENLLIAGMMSGCLLILMGLFKMGSLIQFIPRPVTIGFTSGIAVTIFSGQIANLLGLKGVIRHEDFLSNMKEVFIHLNTLNSYSILVGILCLAAILLTPKILPKIPGPLVGLLTSTIIAAYFFPDKISTIGSTYGSMPNHLPMLTLPHITPDKIMLLLRPAFVIAVLGGIESLLSAVVADGMTGTRHNSNKELVGQGVANLITPLFGGIPATGAIARTATNIRTGATSPISGVIHGLTVLLVLIVFGPYAAAIPLASLAPVLMVVAWNMSQRKSFWDILKTRSYDSGILTVTFLLTVFINLTAAVEIGLILALISFMKRMSEVLVVAKALPDGNHEKVRCERVSEGHACPQITLFNIEGPLFFGAAQMFESYVLNALGHDPKFIILRLGKVPYIDTTGAHNLSTITDHLKNRGIIVLISGIQSQPKKFLEKTGLYDKIGQDHFFLRTDGAIKYAIHHIDTTRCRGCTRGSFKECGSLSAPSHSETAETNLAKGPTVVV